MSVKSIIGLAMAFLISASVGIFGGKIIVDKMKLAAEPVEYGSLVTDDLSDVKEPAAGKTPSDYDAVYNYRYAKKKLMSAASVQTAASGDVYSIMGEHQVVFSSKKFNGTDFFFQTQSIGNFAKVYLRLYHNVTTEDVFRTKNFSNGKWGAYEKMPLAGKDGYIELAGSKPQEFLPYIINSGTVNESTVTAADGNYRLDLSLDPEKAANNYRRYIKDSSDSIIMPVFEAISISVTIDAQWNIIETQTSEKYNIKRDMGVLGIIAAPCEATTKETYTIGGSVEITDEERGI